MEICFSVIREGFTNISLIFLKLDSFITLTVFDCILLIYIFLDIGFI